MCKKKILNIFVDFAQFSILIFYTYDGSKLA